ncbi:MAG: BTAD domain-containing putative transcriptional regulator [Caldilineaceae bacterium]
MSKLELRLLGPPLLLLNGEPVKGFVTRKAEALFIYLATNQQTHRRTTLAAYFWPDAAEKYAHNSLRRAFSNLRTLLGAYIDIDRYTAAFNPQAPYALDVEQFTALLRPPGGANQIPLAANLERALALYRDEFLTGFAIREATVFEDWVRIQREHYHMLALGGLEQLTELYIQQQAYERGLAANERLLTLEPWRETGHQQRMKLLYLAGQPARALLQYDHYLKILAAEFGAEPKREVVDLYQQIKAGALTLDMRPGQSATLRHVGATGERTAPSETNPTAPAPCHNAPHDNTQNVDDRSDATTPPSSVQATGTAPAVQVDWGEAPRPAAFYGRGAEWAQLQKWLLTDQCTLITILGMGGSGKTALAARLTRLVVDPAANQEVDDGVTPVPQHSSAQTQRAPRPFSHVIWRSLVNSPPLSALLPGWLEFLSGYQQTRQPDTFAAQLNLLLSHLRQQRCLLVLDNLESILQAGNEAGMFSPGYAEYGVLIERMGGVEHQSCLLLTSREQPVQAARLERDYPQVQSLMLAGLPAEPSIQIVQAAGLSGRSEEMSALVSRYSGNPLALKLIAETIQDFYAGDIKAFLTAEPLVFDDIRYVLDQQFERLSRLERDILFWLAIVREPISADHLQSQLINPPTKRLFLEALRSLQRRSLLETVENRPLADGKRPSIHFSLQNVITEYLTDTLVERLCQEVERAELDLFHHYGLLNAQAKEYIRDTQTRLLLQPLLASLINRHGKPAVAAQLDQIFQKLRSTSPSPRGYAVANLLHLWVDMDVEMAGYDFSHLEIRQANLRGVRLPRVNLTRANLTGAIFDEIFSAVLSLAYSPDGQLLAAATTDGVVRVWQVAGRQLIGVCPGNGRWVWSVCFSPDGQLLATGCADRAVRIWQIGLLRSGLHAIAEWSVHRTLIGHTDAVFAVCFSPDSQQLASASADGAIHIWQTQTGQRQQSLLGHCGGVNSIAYSPNGATLASASRDQTARLWRVASGQCVHSLHGHQAEVKALAFSPDGVFVATVSYDGTIRIWYSQTGQLYRTIQCETSELECIAFHPDGQSIAVNERDYSIRLWEVANGRIRRSFRGHTNTIHALSFSPDGQRLASGGWDKNIRFWDVEQGHALYMLQGYNNDIKSIAIGNYACAPGASSANTARENGSSSGHQYLANGNSDHVIYLWDLERGAHVQTLRGHTGPVNATAFHPNGMLLASGSADRTVRLWQIDAQQSVLRQTLHGHAAEITSVAFSPQGLCFASAGVDQTIRLWETQTGRSQWILRGHTSQVNTLAFGAAASAPPQLLVSGDDDSNLYIWEIMQPPSSTDPIGERAQPDHVLTAAPPNGIHVVAFSPNGRLLAAGGAEPVIQLWQMPARRPSYTLKAHTSSIYGLAFSMDGTTLASGSGDQSIRLWDPETGALKQTLSSHTGIVQSVIFHPNGQWLISSSSDETIKIWSLATGDVIRTLRPASLYDGMNITGATGITAAQRATLKALGAVEDSLARST